MRYLLAGAFSRSLALVQFFAKHKGDDDFVVYDGVNRCRWNGGRLNRNIFYNDGMIEYYYQHNVGIALTMSNPTIDLSDDVGNHLLEKFHRTGNALIICNDTLRQYVRNYFPKFELIHSITNLGLLNIPLQDSDIAFYHELEEKYDWIVPRFEHIFDQRADELDRSKWEVMVNDTCVYGCRFFNEHFKAIAQANTVDTPYNEETRQQIEECWLPKFDPNKESKHNCMDIDKEHTQKLKDLGVRSFKITGREMTDNEYLEQLNEYVR